MKRPSQPENEAGSSTIDAAVCTDAAVCELVVEQDALARIRSAAYQKWEAAGCPPGDGQEFWFAAEREYLAARAIPDPSGTSDTVQEASEESFPASDPPARTISPPPVAGLLTATAT